MKVVYATTPELFEQLLIGFGPFVLVNILYIGMRLWQYYR